MAGNLAKTAAPGKEKVYRLTRKSGSAARRSRRAPAGRCMTTLARRAFRSSKRLTLRSLMPLRTMVVFDWIAEKLVD